MHSPNRAIDPNRSATVSASAGTGKTWLLVSRIIRLLLNGTSPDSILAITFTRKAAAEMQSRLNERLLDLAKCKSAELKTQLDYIDAPTDAATLNHARKLFEKILHCTHPPRITTFHAFCQDLLKRFPFEANVPPGFELVEQTTELEAEAWDSLVSETTQISDGTVAQALEFLFDYGNGLSNTQLALQNFLRHRSDWWAFTLGQKEPVNFAINHLRQQLKIDDDANPCDSFFSSDILQGLDEFSNLLALHPVKANQKFQDTLLHVVELVKHENFIKAFEQLITVFFNADLEPRSRKTTKVQIQKMGESGNSRFLELHEQFCQQISDILDLLAKLNTFKLSCAWFTGGERLLHHYQTIKQEQRLLDFADLEWNAYLLLTEEANASWVQYKLDARINHILIDEFQDTNPTQWQLLIPLLKELAASNADKVRSVFLVGDTKQSIYRFRRAQPKLFDIAQKWLGDNLTAINQTLDKSRRSSLAITNFVNLIFGSGPLKEQIVHFDTHHTHLENYWGRVSVIPLFDNENDSDSEHQPGDDTVYQQTLRNPLVQPRSIIEDERRNREAQFIADEILRLVTQPTILDEGDSARKAGYNDIIILLRHRTHAAYFEHALTKAGIPYTGINKGTLLDTLEIRDIVALLNILVTPFSNLALAQILKSPLFDFCDQDLITLATFQDGHWIKRLQKLAQLNPDNHRLVRAQRLLAHWQELAGKLPVHDLLDRIYCESNLIERYVAAYPEHLQHRVESNLNRFIELALEIDSGRYPSVGRFLFRLQALRASEQDAPDETPAGKSEARVRLLTIHAAKGLEAPIIFLADTSNTASTKDAYQAIVQWSAEAPRPNHFLIATKKSDRDKYVTNLIDNQNAEIRREEANLLYVALTRAKQLLYITGCEPKRGSELGWYGAITSQLQSQTGDIVQQIANNYVVEFGHIPTTDLIDSNQLQATPTTVDPALSRPITTTQFQKSITPSLTVDDPDGIVEKTDTQAMHRKDESLRLRGVAIHKILQLIMEEENKKTIRQHLKHSCSEELTDEQFNHYWAEANKLVNQVELAYAFDTSQYDTAYNEVPLNFQYQDYNVVGIVDRLVVCKDSVYLIDYKTHLTTNQNTQMRLAESYKQQMSLYYQGVKMIWPDKQIYPQILFTLNGKAYDIDVIPTDDATHVPLTD